MLKLQQFFSLLVVALIGLFLFIPFEDAKTKVPNDPNALQWAYERINVEKAWNNTTGSKDVTVAIIDNGFDHLHPDLQENTWRNVDELDGNGVDDDGNGYIDDVWGWNFVPTDTDDNGEISDKEELGTSSPRPNVKKLREVNKKSIHHGTMVAGLVGAVGNNNLAGSGVNWNINLMNLKVADNSGVGTLRSIPRAIHYAVDNGADVISFSLVGGIEAGDSRDQFIRAVEYAYNHDVALFAAAGNKLQDLDEDPLYPICSDKTLEGKKELIIGVSAINEEQHLTNFSNTGSECIDITAPGDNISSTLRYSPQHGLDKLYGGGWSGTSFAAPLVSGVGALVKSIRPNWGPKKIYDSILANVHKTPGQDPVLYKNLFGNGLLQADKVLSHVVNNIFATNNISGLVGIYGDSSDELIFSKEEDGDYVVPFLAKDKSNVVGIKEDKDYQYASVSEGVENTVVSVISKTKKDKRFKIDYRENVDITVADVVSDSDLEVVVSPKYESSRVFSIYSLGGVKFREYTVSTTHKGVSLSAVHEIGADKDKILTAYSSSSTTVVRKFDDNFTSKKLVEISGQRSIEVDSGDIDGDQKQEFVVAENEAGANPFLSYYESDGTMKRRFYAYDPGYTGGFKVLVANINSDDKDEVITVPNLEQPARVWSDKVKKLKEKNIDKKYKFLIPLK